MSSNWEEPDEPGPEPEPEPGEPGNDRDSSLPPSVLHFTKTTSLEPPPPGEGGPIEEMVQTTASFAAGGDVPEDEIANAIIGVYENAGYTFDRMVYYSMGTRDPRA